MFNCEHLREISEKMIKNNYKIFRFNFEYNSLLFEFNFYDLYEKIIIIKNIKNSKKISFKISSDFLLNINFEKNKYFQLVNLLNINFLNKGFSTRVFFEFLKEEICKNQNNPEFYFHHNKNLSYNLNLIKDYIEDYNHTHFMNFRHNDKNHVSVKNLNKTYFFFDKKTCLSKKEYNISSCWKLKKYKKT